MLPIITKTLPRLPSINPCDVVRPKNTWISSNVYSYMPFILLYKFYCFPLCLFILFFWFKPKGLECDAGSTQTSIDMISLTKASQVWSGIKLIFKILECASALVLSDPLIYYFINNTNISRIFKVCHSVFFIAQGYFEILFLL